MRSAPGNGSGSAMNKLVRLLGLALLIAMALIPPWQTVYSLNGQKQSLSAGYHPLWSPPPAEVDVPEGAADPAHRVNVVRLGIQLLAVLGLMNGSLYLLAKREP